VTSASANEGKTTVAVNLAMALAQNGKTCLVEGDLRKPQFARIFGLPENIGLSQVLAREITHERAFFRAPEVPNLFVMAAGAVVPNPADALSTELMESLITSLRKDFDFVILDSPPAIPFSDARVLSILCDAVILVSRYGLTTRRAMARGVQLLNDVRAPLVGVVLNAIDLNSADYHYYNYGFSRSMRNQYQYYAQPIQKPETEPTPGTKGRGKGAHA
jgi:capsular exopolysaccharide synthesis family protein